MEFRWSGMERLCFLLFLNLNPVLTVSTCKEQNPCHCETTDGHLIDLSLIGSTSGTPRFYSIIPLGYNGSVSLTYNPCYAFTSWGYCEDAAGCLEEHTQTGYYINRIIGKQNTVQWDLSGSPKINYTYGDSSLVVFLKCLPLVGEEIQYYTLVQSITRTQVIVNLYSQCACIDGCRYLLSLKGGKLLSTGTILIIVFISVVLTYLIGGVIINRFVRGARGKEVIPHVNFWKKFPGLVMDGIYFTCDHCGRRKRDQEYTRLLVK